MVSQLTSATMTPNGYHRPNSTSSLSMDLNCRVSATTSTRSVSTMRHSISLLNRTLATRRLSTATTKSYWRMATARTILFPSATNAPNTRSFITRTRSNAFCTSPICARPCSEFIWIFYEACPISIRILTGCECHLTVWNNCQDFLSIGIKQGPIRITEPPKAENFP